MPTGELTTTFRATASDLPRRVVVTLVAIALFLAAKRVHLPLMEWDGAARVFAGMLVYASPLAVGMGPFVAGFLLVEIAALVHPAWRPLRHDPDRGRRTLARAAWILALALATWHAFAHALFLQVLHDHYGHPIVEPRLGPALEITAALVAGTAASGCIAFLVSRYGIGNGFAVLFAVTDGEAVLRTALRMLQQPPDAWSDVTKVVWLAVAVLVPLVLAHVRRVPRPAIPIPTCGLAVIEAPAILFAFPARLAEWIPALAPVAAFVQAKTWLGTIVDLALTLVVAIVFARVFFPAHGVAEAFRRAEPGGPEDAEAVIRAALRAANKRSVQLVVGIALIPSATALLDFPVLLSATTLLAVAIVLAVVADLWAEIKARASAPALVSAYAFHRTYLVEPALRALSSAGIVAFARARWYRMVFQFFAPWAPVEILVPSERAAEAEALCARVVG